MSSVGSLEEFMAYRHRQRSQGSASSTRSIVMDATSTLDPFNFLLQSVGPLSSNNDSSSSSFGEDSSSSFGGASPTPDWPSNFPNLWPGQDPSTANANTSVENLKFDPSSMDFDFSLPMDLDFNNSMAIDPSALHFDNTKLFPNGDAFAPHAPSHAQPSGNGAMQYPDDSFFNQFMDGMLQPSAAAVAAPAPTNQFGQQRSMSVTSSSSGSGASLSPILDHAAAAAAAQQAQALNVKEEEVKANPDPADELAQRVRQAAGVTLAVPVAGQGQSVQSFENKLPIPRLEPRLAPATSFAPTLSPSNPSRTVSSASSPSNSASVSGSSPPASEANHTSPPSAASSPPVATPPSSSNLPIPADSASGPATAVLGGRPKTSHTTIERRYRTNLNARIISLKNAVPALRVLDQKKAKDKANGNAGDADLVEEGLEGGTAEDGGFGDVVDERGIVDGVKVARKISKANVLGKATEYIRVLKRREARLKHEQQGLRSLISGLVGGPALLKEWEREWTLKFGGPEQDELEYENSGRGGASDDEDEGDSDDDDDDNQRKRKRAKVVKDKKETAKERREREKREREAQGIQKVAPAPTVPIAPAGSQQPEKRKRGRPKKNATPPSVAAAQEQYAKAAVEQQIVFESGTGVVVSPQPTPEAQQQQQQQPQYLLAIFAFFSFFSSPLASSSSSSSFAGPHHAHHHTGVVLNSPFPASAVHIPAPSPSPLARFGIAHWGWQETVQAFHLIVSALVFFSIILPWMPRRARKALSFLPLGSILGSSSVSTNEDALPTPPPSPSRDRSRSRSPSEAGDDFNRLALIDALASESRVNPSAKEEAGRLREALDVKEGVVGLLGTVGGRVFGRLWGGKEKGKGRSRWGIERAQLEQRAWVRLGELVAMEPKTPLATRLLTYYGMTTHTSAFAASTNDLITLALMAYPVSKSRAYSLWDKAAARTKVKSITSSTVGLREYERLVLENMGIEDAIERIAALRAGSRSSSSGGSDRADETTTDRLRLNNEFDAVLDPEAEDDMNPDGSKKEEYCRFPDFEKFSPLTVLAILLIRERIRKHAALLFVRSVPGMLEAPEGSDAQVIYDPKKEILEERELKECIEAGKSLGGRAKELCVLLEKIEQPSFVKYEEVLTFEGFVSPAQTLTPSSTAPTPEVDAEERELRTLMSAVVLYRRLFSSAILTNAAAAASAAAQGPSIMLSPPPSPSKRNAKLRTALRVALDSEVFDGVGLTGVESAVALVSSSCGSVREGLGAELDEARDRVVDMLMEVQGHGRGRR